MSRTGLLQLLALFGALLSHSVLAVVSPYVLTKFRCPNNIIGCICEPSGFRRLTLKCFSNGDINDINYEVHFSEEKEILIHCHAYANPWGNFLNGETLNINDPAEYITIHNCPLFSVENFPVVRNNLQPNLVSSDLRFLTNLTSLRIYNSNSNNINANFLCRLPNLRELIIILSNITCLPAGFFNCSKNLLYVSLAFNKFTPQPGVFNGLVSILNLDLSHNNIKNLNSLVFWHLRTLRKLDLSYNDLTEMPNDIFKNLTALKELKLNHNQLTYIPEGTDFIPFTYLTKYKINGLFSTTWKLEILDLSNNNFQFITANDFKFLRNLEYLNMKNNKLYFIYEDAFIYNKNLKIVNFAFNELKISTDTDNLFSPHSPIRFNVHLEKIHLAHNLFAEIFSDSHDLPNLRILDLSDNHINNLKFEDLHFSARNVTVDLQRNKLKTVNLTTLECLKYNKMSDHIRTVYVPISGNPFECTCDSFLRYLNGAMTPGVYNNVKLFFYDDICLNQRINCTSRNDTCINN